MSKDPLTVIADALLHYCEPRGLPRMWGREHSEDQARAVLDALRREGIAVGDRDHAATTQTRA